MPYQVTLGGDTDDIDRLAHALQQRLQRLGFATDATLQHQIGRDAFDILYNYQGSYGPRRDFVGSYHVPSRTLAISDYQGLVSWVRGKVDELLEEVRSGSISEEMAKKPWYKRLNPLNLVLKSE